MTPTGPVKISLIWKKLASNDNVLTLTHETETDRRIHYSVVDFHRSGNWMNKTFTPPKGSNSIILKSKEPDKLFYAKCMICEQRQPCHIYILTMAAPMATVYTTDDPMEESV
jgi:hypothetical protein